MNSTRGSRSGPRPRSPPVSRCRRDERRRRGGGPNTNSSSRLFVGPDVSGSLESVAPVVVVWSSGSVVEVVDVVLVVDDVVVTSSTGIPLGTVSGTVVDGAGFTSASTFTGTAYRGSVTSITRLVVGKT